MVLLLALLGWLLSATTAWADDAPAPDATPPPGPPGPTSVFPSAGDIAGALVAPFTTALTTWFKAVPDTFGGWINEGITQLTDALWAWLMGLLDRFNIITTLPPGLTYKLPAVVQLRDRLTRLAGTLWLLAAICQIVYGAGGTIFGRPLGRLFPGLGRLILAAGARYYAPQVMAGWIDLCNAMSNSLLGLETGLPGMNNFAAGSQRASAELIATGVYLSMALLLLLGRISTLIWIDMLLVVAPLALTVWALPFPLAQRAGAWWCNQFLLQSFTQVLLAIVLALAVGILSAQDAISQDSVSAQLMSVLLFVGLLWTAFRLPHRLNSLAHGATPVRVVHQVVRAAALKAMTGL